MSDTYAGNQANQGVPYGYAYDVDGVTLIPVNQEQEVLLLVRKLISAGLTIAQIATELKRREILTVYYLCIGQNEESGFALPESLQRD